MATLYEIDTALNALIDEETGEIADFEAFQALNMERDTKLENIALWIKNLDADVEAYKAEKLAFDAKQKAAERKRDSLKGLLATALDGNKFKTTKVDCSFRRSKSVTITNLFDIPDEFLRYAEPTPDKAKIKAAIQEGTEIKGATLEVKTTLTIK